MLRTIRLTTALICFTLVTLLFLDFTGTLHTWFGWLAKIQFLPAVLALNLGVVLFLIALTWLLGRVYCSVICPLGIFQVQSAKPPVHLFKTKRFYFEVLFQNEASLLEQNQTAFKWTSNPI